MHKQTLFYIILISFFTSESIAQNLKLKIIGSDEKETAIISNLNYNHNHNDKNSIIDEVDLFEKKIIKIGYINNEQSLIKKNKDSIYVVQFKLNNKYETIEMNFDSTEIKKSTLKSIIKESFDNNFTIPFYNVEETLNLINIKIANNGFPFTKIKLSKIKHKDKKSLTATLIIIRKENKRKLNNIVIKGYKKFPKSYLHKYLNIKPEKTFNIEAIKNKMNTLNNLRFVKQIKDPEVLFTKDSTTLYLYLQKAESNTFDGFLGFSTNEITNKINFNGYINLELNNNLNYGETFNLIYKGDESEQKNFEATLNLPYLFTTPIGTEFSLKILKRDSSFTSVNQKADIYYQFNSKNKLFLGIESSQSSNQLKNRDNSQIEDYKSNLFKITYAYENRKDYNLLFDSKSKIKLELGKGNRKTRHNNLVQEKITLTGHHIFQLNKMNSFFIKTHGRLINSEFFLENELFRFGGINSLRGFKENSILANRFLSINTEYRYLLSSNIYTHTIIDIANFENKPSNTNGNLYGFGLGFGMKTKAGLLKFNFANGKTKEQDFKFSNSKIHISLVSIF